MVTKDGGIASSQRGITSSVAFDTYQHTQYVCKLHLHSVTEYLITNTSEPHHAKICVIVGRGIYKGDKQN